MQSCARAKGEGLRRRREPGRLGSGQRSAPGQGGPVRVSSTASLTKRAWNRVRTLIGVALQGPARQALVEIAAGNAYRRHVTDQIA
jgi:hypothetical protein